MQEVTLHRIAEIIPRLQNEVLRKEEEELMRARKAAQAASEDQTGARRETNTPRVAEQSVGRNELVTITNGTNTQTLKYKRAQALIESGEWRMM